MLLDKSLDLQDIQIFESVDKLNNYLKTCEMHGQTIGFVPTMGALHKGHVSLINESVKNCDITICSIYVNPTQFNNTDDLLKYPRTVEKDITILKNAKCNVVYLPKEEEVYPQGRININYNIGSLATVMEGFYRPGHFQGMITIVKKLFDIVKPNKAFFGEKDFQQLSIIRKMTSDFNLNIEIIGCSIIREENGLAMSSRNERLPGESRERAKLIYETLNKINTLKINNNPLEIQSFVEKTIKNSGFLKLDYFELADSADLTKITNWDDSDNIRAFIAVYCGEIRLIDNIKIN